MTNTTNKTTRTHLNIIPTIIDDVQNIKQFECNDAYKLYMCIRNKNFENHHFRQACGKNAKELKDFLNSLYRYEMHVKNKNLLEIIY